LETKIGNYFVLDKYLSNIEDNKSTKQLKLPTKGKKEKRTKLKSLKKNTPNHLERKIYQIFYKIHLKKNTPKHSNRRDELQQMHYMRKKFQSKMKTLLDFHP